MSEFDKEAEREKLREQFADDDRKRETTQRMSELLLKGATMTNKHCDDCGDPIFRWQDEEFCPSCSAAEGKRVQQQAHQQAQQQTQASQQSPETSAQEGTVDASNGASPDAEAVPDPADAQMDVPLEAEDGSPVEADASRQGATRPTDGVAPAPPTGEPASTPTPERSSSPTPPTASAADTHATGQFADLSDARESLGRTVTRFAREAESAEDLARAREYLTAVEDAADALAAVRRAER